MTVQAGKELAGGRYVVTGILGEGAQGATFDAVDKRDGRPVAVKQFRVRGASSWKDVELAEREARVVARLDHPALPRYVDHFEEDGALFLVMDRVEGESLLELRRRGALRESDVVLFLHEAAGVLDYLHGRSPPVIHRDIKPGNVLRCPDGSFAFVDFGSVRDTLKPEGGSTVVGTFGYMAPEQFQGRAMPVTDVYAVGATALAMLTGEDPDRLPHRGLAIDVEAALRGVASPRMVQVLSALLDPDPDRRPSRIAPLLDGISAERDRPKDWGARRRTRRAPSERGARRATSPPPLVAAMLVLGLVVARLAVFVTLRIAVPMVLSLLALVLGPGLSRAAASVSRAGERAGRRLRLARRGVASSAGAENSRSERDAGERRRVKVPRHRFDEGRADEWDAARDQEAAEQEAEADVAASKQARVDR